MKKLIALMILFLLSGCAFARIDEAGKKASFYGWGTFKSGETSIESSSPIKLPLIKM